MKAILVFFREYFEGVSIEDEGFYEVVVKNTSFNFICNLTDDDIMKYHNVERKILTIGSLYSGDEVRIKNSNLHLDSLLEENSKKEESDDFFIMACGKKESDEEIWRQVSRFPKNATMLYKTEKGFVKVTGIRKSYFEGEEVIFSSKK